jgi:hypothetical protein
MGPTSLAAPVIAASLPKPPFGTSPVKRVRIVAEGEVPASASARSSTPEPHANALGSIAAEVDAHATPPGTCASAPAAQTRPTAPLAVAAARAAASHAGRGCPFASRKYVVTSGWIGSQPATGTPSNTTPCDVDSRSHASPPPATRRFARSPAKLLRLAPHVSDGPRSSAAPASVTLWGPRTIAVTRTLVCALPVSASGTIAPPSSLILSVGVETLTPPEVSSSTETSA